MATAKAIPTTNPLAEISTLLQHRQQQEQAEQKAEAALIGLFQDVARVGNERGMGVEGRQVAVEANDDGVNGGVCE